MDNFWKQYCRECLGIRNENFEKTLNISEDNLDIFLSKMNLDLNKLIVCEVCALKIMEALKFKTICLDTNDKKIPYINGMGNSVDISNIYVKEEGSDQLMDSLCHHEVCDSCIEFIKGKFLSTHETNNGVIEEYVPEFNSNVIGNPSVCEGCNESIGTHSSFVRKCIEVEEKMRHFYNDNCSYSSSCAPAPSPCIKIEQVVIKQEVDDTYDAESVENNHTLEISNMQIKKECVDLKLEKPCKSEDSVFEDDEQCNLSQNSPEAGDNKYSPHQHADTTAEHKRPSKSKKNNKLKNQRSTSETELFGCETCGFKTNYKGCLKRHMLNHKNDKSLNCDSYNVKTELSNDILKQETSEVEGECESSSKYHTLRHGDTFETEVFKCDRCSFETKYKAAIKSHVLTHNKYRETEAFQCDKCDYTCKLKKYLRAHLLKHKDVSEIEMFECSSCDFKTRYKNNYKAHLVKHKDTSEVTMFECDECDYKTRYKHHLKVHLLKHKDISETEVFTCDTCGYKTKYNCSFKKHLLKHKDFSETEVFACTTCDYKTKYKMSLKTHQLVHVNFECDACDYKTKRIGNLKMHLSKYPEHSATCTSDAM